MSFNVKDCSIPTVYCGKGELENSSNGNTTNTNYTYTKKGSAYECLKKGFGAGMWNERKKDIGKYSLLQIPYVNEDIEMNFKNYGIRNTQQLINDMNKLSKDQINKTLRSICKIKNKIHFKSMNSILLFLHQKNVKPLPKCKKL